MAKPEGERRLDQLLEGISTQKVKTKAFWRTGDEKIEKLLRDFVQRDDWHGKDHQDCEEEAQEHLFRPLNILLWKQELQTDTSLADLKPKPGELSVVFGGKHADWPNSISEKLVQLLASEGNTVITVSRSECPSTPENITHVAKKNLDKANLGMKEFRDVLLFALEERAKINTAMTVYFTLGQHKGADPFRRNVMAAQNFADALRSLKAELQQWLHIVITGTDATKPSVSSDSSLNADGKVFIVPTYKIMKYNYVYAMSKICQFCIIQEVFCEVAGLEVVDVSCIAKMKAYIEESGENGNYREGGDISMEELDSISSKCNENFHNIPGLSVAESISICYTPLHRKPWIQAALKAEGSAKGYFIEQVVRRLKNAISVEKAARLHFC